MVSIASQRYETWLVKARGLIKMQNLTMQTQMSRFDWTSRAMYLVEPGNGKRTMQM